ncbi:MAG: prephenate dehydratase [Bacillota bacterium]|nr:prephenate dehydratase [Bacillota bacterium]MDW7683050.1 prephenate dehydratase [Bacillota bacterium]
MTTRIAYLGPQGTFCEEAAFSFVNIAGMEAELVPYPTVSDCAEKVEDSQADLALIPLENSLEGSVPETLDVLTTSLDLAIVAELVKEIQHNLLSTHEDIGSIRRVYSHPQALAQCRRFLRQHLPEAEAVPALSTAEAAAIASRESCGTAALGSIRAAEHYRLHVLSAGVQDSSSRTRFIVLGKEKESYDRPTRTSVLFAVKNEAGSLFRVLQAFAEHQVNMTRIESRPAKSQLGDYIFFVDLDGTKEDAGVKAALRQAAHEAVMLKLLGSYPVLGRENA